ncbi:90kDa heat-shock protein, putative [Perkinsus marinus ATCC 50983]|uniref:90kDa heat-shock protein, putative n=1 Tax=Perkinsus marinus (strain ATCC 50983 / TXsc) TaxID=423536 RepID=C5KHG0_PERM5|nr:90kDa heat-shock protein, putative [Perkinsus marinus ATCC 50983]EER16021.1 90kDa heat-shock protein, putative [Perkinsus marinus ATCC 50983]|eukprot:XP_002784225.1 90kDa heat-shock protein, putative [Perkinsus marinus ATCC 50983]
MRYTPQQERVVRAQSFQDKTQLNMMIGRRTLELNPDHPVIKDLLVKVNEDKADTNAEDTAVVLFQAAMLDSGYEILDPHTLVKKVYSLMSQSLGVDPNTPVAEVEVPEDEEEVEEPPAEEESDDSTTIGEEEELEPDNEMSKESEDEEL